MNTIEFIKRSREVHGDRYDYSKVDYVNPKTKVCIICPEHGEFWQTPDSHLRGCECPRCAGRKKMTTEEHKNTNNNNLESIDFLKKKTRISR